MDNNTIDWEQFQFPTKPVGFYLHANNEQIIALTEPLNLTNNSVKTNSQVNSAIQWHYHSAKGALQNIVKNKRIYLEDLNTHKKIFRFLTAIEAHYTPEECDSIFEAMNAAALGCYGRTLNQLLNDKQDQVIYWNGADFDF